VRPGGTSALTPGQGGRWGRAEALQRSQQLRAPGAALPRLPPSLGQDNTACQPPARTECDPASSIYSY